MADLFSLVVTQYDCVLLPIFGIDPVNAVLTMHGLVAESCHGTSALIRALHVAMYGL